jgi:hypothetical protein
VQVQPALGLIAQGPQALDLLPVVVQLGRVLQAQHQLSLQLRHRCCQRLADQAVGMRDRAQAEADTHDVREHVLHLALREVKLPGKRPHQGQCAWAQLPVRHARWQGAVVLLSAAPAHTAQAHVFGHDGLNPEQLEDLVANGLVAIRLNSAAAGRALGWRGAQNLARELVLGQGGAKAALVPWLATQAFVALGFGGAGRCARAVAGWGL